MQSISNTIQNIKYNIPTKTAALIIDIAIVKIDPNLLMLVANTLPLNARHINTKLISLIILLFMNLIISLKILIII